MGNKGMMGKNTSEFLRLWILGVRSYLDLTRNLFPKSHVVWNTPHLLSEKPYAKCFICGMRRDRQQLRKGMIALMRSEANLMGIELLDLAYMAEQKVAPPNRDGVHFHRKVGFAFLNV